MMLKPTNPIRQVNRIAYTFVTRTTVIVLLCISIRPAVVVATSGGPPKVFRTLYEEVCQDDPTKRTDADFERDQRGWISAHRDDITPRAIEIAKGLRADIIWMRVLPLVPILQSQELEAVLLERCRNTQEEREQSWIVGTLGMVRYRPAREFIEEIVLVPDQDYSLRKSGIFALGKIGDENSARILERLDARLRAGTDDANTAYARLDIRRAIDQIRGTVRVAKTKYDQSTPKAAARALIKAVHNKDWEAYVDLMPELMQIAHKYKVLVKDDVFREVFESRKWMLVLQDIGENIETATIQTLDGATATGGTTVLKVDSGHSIEFIKEDSTWRVVTFH